MLTLDWFSSYLKSRKQRIKINNVLSDEYDLNIYIGVPQGSVVEPFLFMVYMNTLCSFKLRGKFFADNIALSWCGSYIDIFIAINENV